ncbi:hypothetical protein IHE61_04495 [Streptomyces sp. GKU 257-1]|nr:hypothetical protein [Streptomyces sp. GKU 257-1]
MVVGVRMINLGHIRKVARHREAVVFGATSVSVGAAGCAGGGRCGYRGGRGTGTAPAGPGPDRRGARRGRRPRARGAAEGRLPGRGAGPVDVSRGAAAEPGAGPGARGGEGSRGTGGIVHGPCGVRGAGGLAGHAHGRRGRGRGQRARRGGHRGTRDRACVHAVDAVAQPPVHPSGPGRAGRLLRGSRPRRSPPPAPPVLPARSAWPPPAARGPAAAAARRATSSTRPGRRGRAEPRARPTRAAPGARREPAPGRVGRRADDAHLSHRGQLLGGVRNFQRSTAPLVRDELARLAREGQRPSQLFLTCADSRVVTSMITSSGPGDLFTVRNVGNLVPPPGEERGDQSVAAAIEYAVDVLRVASVTVCGHSGCGAMQALHTAPADAAEAAGTPLGRWLQHGRPSLERFRTAARVAPRLADRETADPLEALCLTNVVQQLEHLAAHACVARRLGEGTLELHGMYFHVGEAQTYVLDAPAGDVLAPDPVFAAVRPDPVVL